jgi:hypothetical protein
MKDKKSRMGTNARLIIVLAMAFLASPAAADSITVTIENLAASDGLFFTPVWVGFHNGSFDTFDVGSPASSQVETVAEEGDTGPLSALFSGSGTDTTINDPGGPGPGLYGPGGSGNAVLNVDPSERYFSFASMILPSNDAFMGNDSPTAYEIFDAGGNFTNPGPIMIMGSGVWDAGSELNDTMGAPFSQIGGTSTNTNDNISAHPGLNDFVGTLLGNGNTLGQAFDSATPIAKITITPEPTSALLLLAAGCWRYTRRRQSR